MIGTQKDNKNAYILFKEVESVPEALKLNNYQLNNADFTQVYHLRVDTDEKKEDDFTTSVFVGNLPFIINEEELRHHFQGLGNVINIRIGKVKKIALFLWSI